MRGKRAKEIRAAVKAAMQARGQRVFSSPVVIDHGPRVVAFLDKETGLPVSGTVSCEQIIVTGFRRKYRNAKRIYKEIMRRDGWRSASY